MIDSYLYFYFDNISDAGPAVLKLDLEISDAMIICRHCGDEIEVKDAALELIRSIVQPGVSWIKL